MKPVCKDCLTVMICTEHRSCPLFIKEYIATSGKYMYKHEFYEYKDECTYNRK